MASIKKLTYQELEYYNSIEYKAEQSRNLSNRVRTGAMVLSDSMMSKIEQSKKSLSEFADRRHTLSVSDCKRKGQYTKTTLPRGLVEFTKDKLDNHGVTDRKMCGMCFAFVDNLYIQGYKQESEWPSLNGVILRTFIPARSLKSVRETLVDAGVILHSKHFKTPMEYGCMAHSQQYHILPYETVRNSNGRPVMDRVEIYRNDISDVKRRDIIDTMIGGQPTDCDRKEMMRVARKKYDDDIKRADGWPSDIEAADSRYQYYVRSCNDVMDASIWSIRSHVNDRVHHSLTNFPTDMLRVLQKNHDLVEIDIKNSQVALITQVFPSLKGTQFDKDAGNGVVYEKIMKALGTKDRKVGKQCFIRVLFDYKYREKDSATQAIEKVYPELAREIKKYKKHIEREFDPASKLAVKLQKVEASYMIDGVFMDERLKHIPCFTRHDSIVVPRQFYEKVMEVVKDKIDFTCSISIKWYGPRHIRMFRHKYSDIAKKGWRERSTRLNGLKVRKNNPLFQPLNLDRYEFA